MESTTVFSQIIGPIRLPLEVDGQVDYHQLYYFEYNKERWATAIYGDIINAQAVPLRIESACFFGHVFHSRQCDCGFQLMEAFSRIRKEKTGLVIYGIDQDARGLGIASHFRIYDLRQNHNLDTEEVFKELKADLDSRSYQAVIEILKFLNIKDIKLLSNNPQRIELLQKNGFNIQREELEAPLDRFNMATLMLEKEDLGYKWSFETHAHWLSPIQRLVEGNLNKYAGRLVSDNKMIVAEWSGSTWDVAKNLSCQLENRENADCNIIAYLSDFPRLDEIKVYSSLNVSTIVVPFANIPTVLMEESSKYNIKLQDWERENKYTHPRDQWELTISGNLHKYKRGNQAFDVNIHG